MPEFVNQCQFHDGKRTCLRSFTASYRTIVCPTCRDYWTSYQRRQINLTTLQGRFSLEAQPLAVGAE